MSRAAPTRARRRDCAADFPRAADGSVCWRRMSITSKKINDTHEHVIGDNRATSPRSAFQHPACARAL
jgi:hypothetical protein